MGGGTPDAGTPGAGCDGMDGPGSEGGFGEDTGGWVGAPDPGVCVGGVAGGVGTGDPG